MAQANAIQVASNAQTGREPQALSVNYDYPATVERDEEGRYLAFFADFGWGATDGASLEEALDEAKDLLRELIATTIREGAALPSPSAVGDAQIVVHPPLQIALKAALYDAFREAGASTRRFARGLAVPESDVEQMLNPTHATKAGVLDDALRHLGKEPSLVVHDAGA